MNILIKFINLFSIFFSKYYFTFIDNYNSIKFKSKKYLFEKLNENSEIDTIKFEKSLSNYFGGGYAKNFASARMALYVILKSLNYTNNDNICVTAFTCSAVINSIKRLNIKIKYIDIDISNYGTSFYDLKEKVDKNTKAVLAQHTFGFPCEILLIKQFCKEKNIILIEDCALTFGSSINNTKLGTFGDFAIFSFDQTKPFSTFLGGCLYTKNELHYQKILNISKENKNLNFKMQKAIFKRIIFNYKYNHPIISSKFIFIDLIINILIRKGYIENPYLDSDFFNLIESRYPYPANYPNFLSSLGILTLNNFSDISKIRKDNIKNYLINFSQYSDIVKINDIYLKNFSNIETNRFVILHPKANIIRKKLNSFLKSNLIWFKKPIEAGYDDLSQYGYDKGDCKNAETISEQIINLPLDISTKQINYISKKFINICRTI